MFFKFALLAAGTPSNSTSLEGGYTTSDGCSALENSHGNETITKAQLMCAMRGGIIAHCGLQLETSKGMYALAQNSKTMAGPINSPSCTWCQSGGMPMKDATANGNCKGCGGWLIAGPNKDVASGSFKTLGDFMKDVKKLGDERPYYNIAACETHASNAANCQLTASTLYHKLTGKRAAKCTACDSSCF